MGKKGDVRPAPYLFGGDDSTHRGALDRALKQQAGGPLGPPLGLRLPTHPTDYRVVLRDCAVHFGLTPTALARKILIEGLNRALLTSPFTMSRPAVARGDTDGRSSRLADD